MIWGYSVPLVWVVLFVSNFAQPATTCWGPASTDYGDTTPDYDLLVGSELIVDCSLKSGILPKIQVPVNSSYLVFKKDSNNQLFSYQTQQIDALTAQLRIPNASVNDSGMYHCQIVLPDNSKHLVCSTNVCVGYPPEKVTNFKCISRNFDNLTCTWDIQPNNVRTNYSLQKVFLFQNILQNCPKPNNTFCQWRNDTDPPYQTIDKNLTFIVHGNNSLGTVESEFKFERDAIVIPNSPVDLTALDIGKQSITIQWFPPKMVSILEKPALRYEIWLEELEPNPEDKIVVDAGVSSFNFTFNDLIPNFQYNLSVRCRSNRAKDHNMWSPFVSIVLKTYPDVPYSVPEINEEAFLMHNFGNYRNTTLYWKPVSRRFFNGEDFHSYYTKNHQCIFD